MSIMQIDLHVGMGDSKWRVKPHTTDESHSYRNCNMHQLLKVTHANEYNTVKSYCGVFLVVNEFLLLSENHELIKWQSVFIFRFIILITKTVAIGYP